MKLLNMLNDVLGEEHEVSIVECYEMELALHRELLTLSNELLIEAGSDSEKSVFKKWWEKIKSFLSSVKRKINLLFKWVKDKFRKSNKKPLDENRPKADDAGEEDNLADHERNVRKVSKDVIEIVNKIKANIKKQEEHITKLEGIMKNTTYDSIMNGASVDIRTTIKSTMNSSDVDKMVAEIRATGSTLTQDALDKTREVYNLFNAMDVKIEKVFEAQSNMEGVIETQVKSLESAGKDVDYASVKSTMLSISNEASKLSSNLNGDFLALASII